MARFRRRAKLGTPHKIYKVCRLTPDVKHWMPTREAWIKDHLEECPEKFNNKI